MPRRFYPVTIRSFAAFKRWLTHLTTLAELISQGDRDPIDPNVIKCDCCGDDMEAGLLYNGHWDPLNEMVEMPCCGLDVLLSCVKSTCGPPERCPRCPACFFQLLHWDCDEEPETLEEWLDKLEVVDVKTMDEEDRCCAICHEDFGGADTVEVEKREDGATETTQEGVKGQDEGSVIQAEEIPEHPVRVKRCNHIFGNRCLENWMSPPPEGGNSNTCPSCRGVLMPDDGESDEEWDEESDEESDDESDDESDGWLTVHQGFSDDWEPLDGNTFRAVLRVLAD